MKRLILFSLILFAFLFTAGAQKMTYTYSGFGGGLPNTVVKYQATPQEDIETSMLEGEEKVFTEEQVAPKKKGMSKTTKNIIIGTTVGVVVIAGVIVTVILVKNSADSCEKTCSNSLDESCSNFGNTCSDGCSESMSDSCSNSSTQSCNTKKLFTSGMSLSTAFGLFPIFIP